MITAFSRALAQLSDPAFRRIIWRSVLLAALVFVTLFATAVGLLAQTTLLEVSWLDTVVDLLGGVAALVISWVFFPSVVGLVIALFLEDVSKAVEARHYPDLGPARAQPMGELLVSLATFLALALALNLVVLIFLILPPIFPFVFYGVNGYLLSREFFEMIAFRRMDRDSAQRLRRANRGSLMLFGILIALLFTVPIVNLVAPVVATSAMVHLVEAWRRRADLVLGATKDVA